MVQLDSFTTSLLFLYLFIPELGNLFFELVRPGLPPRGGDLFDREEKAVDIAGDLAAIETYINDHSPLKSGAA